MPELPEVEHYRRILQPLIWTTETATTTMRNSPSASSEEDPSAFCHSHQTQTQNHGLKVTLPKRVATPKVFPTDDEWETIVQRCFVRDIQRKGKLLRLLLCPLQEDVETMAAKQQQQQQPISPSSFYLYMHMGMTGRVSSPHQKIPTLKSLETKSKAKFNDDDKSFETETETEASKSTSKRARKKQQDKNPHNEEVDSTNTGAYPPPHTHVILTAMHNQYQVAFSDPRRFGGISLVAQQESSSSASNLHQQWSEWAPDILDSTLTATSQTSNTIDPYTKLTGQSRGIKSLLLDQRYAISGIGNWIADEVLYHSHIHPDQSYLTLQQVQALQQHLIQIVTTAIQCNIQGIQYPATWIFHARWTSTKAQVTDSQGKRITFITSGGRTSAIVPALQKKRAQKPPNKSIKERRK